MYQYLVKLKMWILFDPAIPHLNLYRASPYVFREMYMKTHFSVVCENEKFRVSKTIIRV